MGITEDQFKIIWQAISWWKRNKGLSSAYLASLTEYPKYRIERGITGKSEWITSSFVHGCMEAFGLTIARQRGPEDTTDILTDEECVEALTAPLREIANQGRFWE